MTKHGIHITIIDDSRAVKCAANCGTDWSVPANLSLARERVRASFGDGATVEYIDLSRPATSPQAASLPQPGDEGLTLPVLAISGRPRLYGNFDIRMLLDVISADAEISGAGEEDEDG